MSDKFVVAKLALASKRGEFTLASGRTSDFYVDARKVTMDPECVFQIGRIVYHAASEAGVSAVGGPATAALPLVTAASFAGALAGKCLTKSFYVRGERKDHGTKSLLEGLLPNPGERVLVVDDVLTSGGSLLKAIRAIREETKAVVDTAFVLVDREEGGPEVLYAEGVRVRALTNKSQIFSLLASAEVLGKEVLAGKTIR